MIRPDSNLDVRPIFMDAISGEFVAPQDPQRTHTLGKLLIATYQKGDLFSGEDQPPHIPRSYAYDPSWLSSVRAILKCYEGYGRNAQASELLLRRYNKPDPNFDLIVSTSAPGDTVQAMQISVPKLDIERVFPFRLDTASEARRTFSEVAGTYFNAIA